jgi:hypothetical protein
MQTALFEPVIEVLQLTEEGQRQHSTILAT